jgi:hypothetical protein
VHRALRRLASLLVLAIPLSFVGRAESTWGAAPAASVPPRAPRAFEDAPLASERANEERAESAVVLVVLDGVRWQEIFGAADRSSARALVPNLQRLLETRAVGLGAPGHGAEVSASGPQFISLPGYREIFAGHPDPLCASNACERPSPRTIVDEVRDASGADEVAVVASWPGIARAASADLSGVLVSVGRRRVERGDLLLADAAAATWLDRGAHARPWPGEGDYRPDAFTAQIALRALATLRPRFLFVGLGDADEYAHRADYRGYLQAVHASDAFVGDLFATLDSMGARGRHTTVLVTADHGRAYDFRDHGGRYPESGRVWLVAAGGDLRTHGLLAAARRHTLSDLAPTVRALLGMPAEGQPIHELLGATVTGTPGPP